MTGSMSHRAGLGALVLCAVAVMTASAHTREFAQAQKANADALRNYTWKSRTELKLKGETRNVRLDQVRYDFDGRLQKTQIAGGSEKSESSGGRARGGGPIRQRVVAKKKEEFKELMAGLAGLADSYAHLSASTLQTFAAHASITKGQGIESGSLRIQGRSVVSAGDEMVLWIDPVSYMIRRVEITTALEGKPVHVVADYRALDNGLSYQARAVLRYPKEDLNVTIENFDYQFVGGLR